MMTCANMHTNITKSKAKQYPQRPLLFQPLVFKKYHRMICYFSLYCCFFDILCVLWHGPSPNILILLL
jgi:hypothetical protein